MQQFSDGSLTKTRPCYSSHNNVNLYTTVPSVLWRCWLGDRKSIWPVKIWNDEVLAWSSVWSKVQMNYIWSSWCHCHPIISASAKSRSVYTGQPKLPGKKIVCVCNSEYICYIRLRIQTTSIKLTNNQNNNYCTKLHSASVYRPSFSTVTLNLHWVS